MYKMLLDEVTKFHRKAPTDVKHKINMEAKYLTVES